MRDLVTLTILVVLGVAVWFYVSKDNVPGSRVPEGAVAVERHPEINPETFSRQDALDDLSTLETASIFDFKTALPRKNVEASALPKIISPFITAPPGGTVKAEQVADGSAIYFASYFSESPMPENYLSQLKVAKQNGFSVVRGVRSQLASTIDLQSAGYQVRVSQLAVSAERTEVMIYVKTK